MIDPRIGPATTVDAPAIGPSTSITEAAQLLRSPDVPALVVTDEADDVVGVVTESDLVALLAETDDLETVAQCMSSPVTTVEPTATVSEAADAMSEAGVRRLPVVDDRGVYHGLVSTATIAPYCSRRSLDVEWDDDPLRVEAATASEVAAPE